MELKKRICEAAMISEETLKAHAREIAIKVLGISPGRWRRMVLRVKG